MCYLRADFFLNTLYNAIGASSWVTRQVDFYQQQLITIDYLSITVCSKYMIKIRYIWDFGPSDIECGVVSRIQTFGEFSNIYRVSLRVFHVCFNLE